MFVTTDVLSTWPCTICPLKKVVKVAGSSKFVLTSFLYYLATVLLNVSSDT